MKYLIPVCLAILVGVGTIPYVYGFKKAYSENPFIYAAICNFLCGLALLVFSLFQGIHLPSYISKYWGVLLLSAAGITLGNITNYYIINRFGASYWLLASLSMLLLPSFIVGGLIFKEQFNLWIIPCIICALLTVVFFALSKQ